MWVTVGVGNGAKRFAIYNKLYIIKTNYMYILYVKEIIRYANLAWTTHTQLETM